MIKRLILALPLSLLGLPGMASAADLSLAPAYKAPPAAPMPYYNWNGFYIGANIGGGFGNANYINSVTATGVAVSGNSASVGGVAGGGQIGYNFMMSPNFLIGIEADVDGANINGSATATSGAMSHSFNTDVFGTVRGRAGWTWNNWLIYGTGGFAWGNEQVTRNQLIGTTGGAGPGTSEQVSSTATGWTAGGGVEWGISPNWTARVEYLWVNLGTNSYSFPISGRTASFEDAFNVVRFGVNYKF